MLIDPFERHVTYLRVSVTDRCDFRCVYCMSEHMSFLPKAELLTLEELDRLCSAFVGLGVRKLRITGGEPLVRKGVIELFESLGRHLRSGALDELTLTTNGSQLPRHAERLYAAGVRRVNISLDTRDPREIRQDHPLGPARPGDGRNRRGPRRRAQGQDQHRGAARRQRGTRSKTSSPGAGAEGHDLTFIETMPLGEIDGDRTEQYLPLSMVRAKLRKRWTLDESDHRTGGPARYVTVRETGQRLGFITPLTHNFCESCNRVRLTCTGTLYMCLGQEDAADLRTPLRRSESGRGSGCGDPRGDRAQAQGP